ncbi:YfdX family protein [Pseudomonas aeruginosa]
MNIKQPQYIFSALALAVVVGLSGPALAQSAAGSSPGAAAPSAASKAALPQVDDKVAREAAKKRAELAQDAITALAKTHEALILLDAKKTKEALAALELASGKLELVLAREPKLALAPVDVSVITHDIHADVESVKKAVKLSRELLDDDEVQKARPIVANLASEIVIETDNLPMATYPAAIKSAARLIDSGKIDNAKAELARALNTLVVTSVAFPLPVLRKRLANTPPRFFQLAAWCPPVFGGHHFKPLAEDLPCQANAAPIPNLSRPRSSRSVPSPAPRLPAWP